MGSHAVTYAVVALAIAAVCLVAGFLWGRSNVRAQIEHAVEKEHVALDAREFAMRTQLEDAIAENARLRPLAEELARLQKRLEQEQGKYARMKAEFGSSFGAVESKSEEPDEPAQVEAPPSADEAIHKLLQSLEAFNAPNAEKPASAMPASVAPDPATVAPAAAETAPSIPSVQPTPKPLAVPEFRPASSGRAADSPQPAPADALPAAARVPAPQTPAPATAPGNPVPAPVRKPASANGAKPGQTVDEWQEFARQLEALTGKKK